METLNDLVALLRHRAATTPDKMAYSFVKDGKEVSASYSYAELDEAARAIAVTLTGHQGERALLLYPPGIEFLAGFFGTLYAGMIAIPAPPPDTARLKRTLPRLNAIVNDAEAAWVITTANIQQQLQAVMDADEGSQTMAWLASDRVDLTQASMWQALEAIDPQSIAYLQYTSGSTSTPKGVMLTHANIMRHSAVLKRSFAYDESSVEVTWMPYFHDYGLVDGLIQPLYSGIPCYILSPLTFLKRPLRWLEVISRFKGTHTQAPNFAYEACIQKITPKQRQQLDLSSLREASNGAEPIRRDTVERFIQTFAECGLDPEALYMAYGLAEATLLVTAKPHQSLPQYCYADATLLEQQHRIEELSPEGERPHRAIVSCGVPGEGMDIVIVDPDTKQRLPDGEVGEIWISGESVGAGYWQRPEESEATFRARLIDQPQRGPFLRSGDLGFMLRGELYMTGREKDLIIIAGVNHYPQDIEWTLQTSSDLIRRDHCAAFAIESDGEEHLVVVAEVEQRLEDWQPLLASLRRAISETHEVELYGLQLLRKGQVLKTSSGKIQRRGCRQAWLDKRFESHFSWCREDDSGAGSAESDSVSIARQINPETLRRWLRQQLSQRLHLSAAMLNDTTPLADYGLTSRAAVELIGALEEWLGEEGLSGTLLWEYPTIDALCRHLSGVSVAIQPAPKQSASTHEPIALIGIGCRLPGGSDSPEAYWAFLCSESDGVIDVPAERWDSAALYDPIAGTPGRINNRSGGFIEGVDQFDPTLFGITPPEAEVMDPQQRLLLECSWQALESARLNPDQLAGSDTGVFIGISTHDYSEWQLADRAQLSPYTAPAQAYSIAANRLSYCFDFHGPSMAIDTACSSSLVALHQAVAALRRGECSLALSGGVNLLLSPTLSIALSQAQMLSPDGRCKTFDAEANGYVRSEGCGVVVLKRLSEAERDGDPILAVVRGTAVNQDGRSNGLTAPNGLAQQAVIRAALADSGVVAGEIGYVETHGTGTALGDPIEFKSLQAVLGEGERPCRLGAVKSRVGHLEAAAGMAGLIKSVLAIHHRQLPPNGHFKTLNPLIELAGSRFELVNTTQPWPEAVACYSAISSFGFGGTNAHAILSAAPVANRGEESGAPTAPLQQTIVLLSAQQSTALRQLADRYRQRLKQSDQAELAAIGYSSAVSRPLQQQRLALVGESGAELLLGINQFLAAEASPHWQQQSQTGEAPAVVWLFSGQGAQYRGMGEALYRREPLFRAAMDRCDQILAPLLGLTLPELFWSEAAESKLNHTRYTQPALFALEWSLAQLLLHWGIEPQALIGHSVGEYVAATISGLLSLEQGLRLICRRAELMGSLPAKGSMVAVMATEAELKPLLAQQPEVVVATRNGPANVVIAGESHAVANLVTALEQRQIETRPLSVSHAFHTPQMEPILADFAAAVAQINFGELKIPLMANVSGDWGGEELATPDYWVNHLRQPVEFGQGLQRLLDQGYNTFIDIGPRPNLLGLGAALAGGEAALWLPTLRSSVADGEQLSRTVAALALRGVAINWERFYATDRSHRVALPRYPWQRQRFWLSREATAAPLSSVTNSGEAMADLLGEAVVAPLLESRLYQSVFSLQRLPLYAQHRVFGEVVVPGAGHLSLLLEAAKAEQGQSACRLTEVIFPQPLVLPAEGERTVQLQLNPEGSFALVSFNTPNHYEEHATGRLMPLTEPRLEAAPLPLWQRQCGQLSEPFYEHIWQSHIELGEEFRWIRALWRGERAVLARLEPPLKQLMGEQLQLHPGLFDSTLQVLAALVAIESDEVVIPFAIDRLDYYGRSEPLPQPLWSYIELLEEDEARGEVVSRVELVNERGARLLHIEGFRAKRVAQQQLLRELRKGYDDHLYHPDWLPFTDVAPAASGRWAVVADRAGIALSLLQAEGVDDYQTIALDQLHSLEREGVTALLFAAPLDLESGDDAALQPLVAPLLTLLGQLTDSTLTLWLLTRGGAAVAKGATLNPAVTALVALWRVIAREYPQLCCQWLDLPLDGSPNSLPPLLALKQSHELAWHNGQLWQQQLQRYNPSALATVSFCAEASYLISGGLGDIGLLLAEWLVMRGAGAVVLIARRAPDQGQQQRLLALRQQAQVVLLQADVTDFGALQAGLAPLRAELPPLKGVFHLAGRLDDAPLTEQSWQRFETVMAAKMAGCRHLHQLTLDDPLDHFVTFSSIAALLGSAGQANYALANGWLDGFIAQRRSEGRVGLSINWGPWSLGMATVLQQRFYDLGIEPLQPQPALMTLGRLLGLGSEHGHMAVASIDWNRFGQRSTVTALYRHFVQIDSRAGGELLTRLQQADREERHALLEQALRHEVASALGLADGRAIAPRKRLFELGLDSLGAVELKNRLATRLNTTLRSTLLFDFPTLEALQGHIADEVLGWQGLGDSDADKATEAVAAELAAALEGELEQLSEDELAQLLAEELGQAPR
ncbi:SDR family NAD(P)-dependent oxidoreductase [Ectothiorhodospiraceae bacterium BW-2]|nr:SDR family NAD(P)-dependent oxidoreductase [Ectothiorhodospiraceae bacterium BW-2]